MFYKSLFLSSLSLGLLCFPESAEAKVKKSVGAKVKKNKARPVAVAATDSKSEKNHMHRHHMHHHHHDYRHEENRRVLRPTPVSAPASQHVGYWAVPGTDTYLSLSGYVKLDAIFDANTFTGDSSNLYSLPLRRWDAEAARQGIFRMHAKESRIRVASRTDTCMGPIETVIIGDFYGTNNFGENLNRSSVSLSSYNFRVNKAYGTFRNWLAGQNLSTFMDADVWGTWLEFNGPASLSRHPMIQYDFQINHNFSLKAAAEFTPTEYTNEQGTLQENSSWLGGSTNGHGLRTFPDLVLHLRYQGTCGHFAVRLLGREQSIRRHQLSHIVDEPELNSHSFGWGVGLSGRLKTMCNDSLFGQFDFGRGIGSYIFDLPGQAMALVGENFNVDGSSGRRTARLRALGTQWHPQLAWVFKIGYEHYWMENLKTNIAYAHSQVNISRHLQRPILPPVNGGTGILPVTQTIRHWIGNIIWSPVKKFDVGFEYSHYRREATGNHTGIGNRFQISFKYYY